MSLRQGIYPAIERIRSVGRKLERRSHWAAHFVRAQIVDMPARIHRRREDYTVKARLQLIHRSAPLDRLELRPRRQGRNQGDAGKKNTFEKSLHYNIFVVLFLTIRPSHCIHSSRQPKNQRQKYHKKLVSANRRKSCPHMSATATQGCYRSRWHKISARRQKDSFVRVRTRRADNISQLHTPPHDDSFSRRNIRRRYSYKS